MKILIFNTLYSPYSVGGAEKSVQVLAEGLVKYGNEVTVVSTTPEVDFDNILEGVKVYYVNNENVYWGFDNEENYSIKKTLWHTIDSYNLFIKKKIERIIKVVNPDIVHTNNVSGFSISIWDVVSKLNIKLVHTLRDYHLLCPKVTMYNGNNNCESQCLSCKIFSIPKKSTSSKVDAVVGISEFILEKHLTNNYFKNSIINTVIGNEVTVNVEPSKTIDTNRIVFGFIGQINKSKGVEILLDTFSKLNKNKNWKLLIAGKGNENYINNLKTIYGNYNIEFIGVVNSSFFYSKIDILVVPSLWNEPFGRVVVEGIKHNKYVLASARGGIIELLKNEDTFNPDNNDLFDKINNILINKTIPEQTNNFDERVTENYISLYKKVLLK